MVVAHVTGPLDFWGSFAYEICFAVVVAVIALGSRPLYRYKSAKEERRAAGKTPLGDK